MSILIVNVGVWGHAVRGEAEGVRVEGMLILIVCEGFGKSYGHGFTRIERFFVTIGSQSGLEVSDFTNLTCVDIEYW